MMLYGRTRFRIALVAAIELAFIVIANKRRCTTNAFVMTTTTRCPMMISRKFASNNNNVLVDDNRISGDNENNYDAIVIGSGMGGLVAGNVLVNAGRKVLMLESHTIPGGFTTNFYRKGYRFEVSTHLLTGCENGGAIGDVLDSLQIDEKSIEFNKLHELMRWIDPSHNIDYIVPLSLKEHIRELSKLFPDQEDGIKEFYHRYYPVVEFVLSYKQKKGLDAMMYALGNIPLLLRLLSLKGKTASDILDPLVTNPACRDIMTIMTLIFGLDYTELDAPIFLFGSMGHFADSAYYPKGGSGNISKVLADHFCKQGGTLHLKTHVDEILFDNKHDKNNNNSKNNIKRQRPHATGVGITDKNGNAVTVKSKCVIVGCDTNTLVTQLCPQGVLPDTYVKSILERTPGPSAVLTWAGLDLDLRKQPYDINTYELIRNNEPHQTPELLNHIADTADYSNIPFTGVTVYSNIDPTCCPPGKSVILSIFVASQNAFEKALGPNGERGDVYKALKNKVGKQFMSHMSRALGIPNLEKHAEVVEVATPITLKRYTGHRDGSFMGWKLTPNQGAFSDLPGQPPIENLFSCGQWVNFGGVSNVMTTGMEAGKKAERFLKEIDRQQQQIASHTPETQLIPAKQMNDRLKPCGA